MRQPEEILKQIQEIQTNLPETINSEHLAFRVSLDEMSELFRYFIRQSATFNLKQIGRRQGCTMDGMRVLLDTEIDDKQKEKINHVDSDTDSRSPEGRDFGLHD